MSFSFNRYPFSFIGCVNDRKILRRIIDQTIIMVAQAAHPAQKSRTLRERGSGGTIGYGIANGSIPFDSFGGGGGSPGGGGFGGGQGPGGNPFGGSQGFGGFGSGGRFRTAIDEETLKKIAAKTGGNYYSATSADELQNVFQKLPTYLISKHETTEISAAFAAIGALLVATAFALSLVWRPMP